MSKPILMAIILVLSSSYGAPPPQNGGINVENLQKLASLSPEQLQLMLHYLENPFIAQALVEKDKGRKKEQSPAIPPTTATIPAPFNEPAESSNLENYLIQKGYQQRGRPLTQEEALRDPIIGPYFTGGLRRGRSYYRPYRRVSAL